MSLVYLVYISVITGGALAILHGCAPFISMTKPCPPKRDIFFVLPSLSAAHKTSIFHQRNDAHFQMFPSVCCGRQQIGCDSDHEGNEVPASNLDLLSTATLPPLAATTKQDQLITVAGLTCYETSLQRHFVASVSSGVMDVQGAGEIDQVHAHDALSFNAILDIDQV